jgi:signal transduction histidine kinase
MSERASAARIRPARWPWALLAIFVTIAMVGLVLVAVNRESTAAQVPFIIAFLMFGVVGALIVSRDGRNLIGLMLLYASVMTACSFLSGELFTWLVVRGHSGPYAVFLGLMNNFGWLVGILPVIFVLPLVFPDGHLPSPRWRGFLWFIVAFLVALGVFFIVGQKTLSGSNEAIDVTNPFFVDMARHLPNMDVFVGLLFPVIFLTSVGSLFVRFRRATGIERQQIKWVAFGLSFALVTIVVGGFIPESNIVSAVIQGAGFLAFPASIGIAVLRFRLYDLDIVVRKTVVYATLALFATIVYLALVVGLGAWLGRGSSFLTLVAAVIVAVTFQPIRVRVSRVADRVVYGRRANPYEVLTEFSSRVGGAYATEDVVPRMTQLLGQGTGAEVARVWLRVGRELRPGATWPSDAAPARAVPIEGDTMPSIPGEYAVAVRDRGELLGGLSVAMPASDPMNPAKERLVADLAGQAGLVLRNVGLVEELRESRRRLVAAQDVERRKLERNIHDGAQQQLVALAVKLKLAHTLMDRDLDEAHRLVAQLEDETRTALEELRDLARGIYPPLLADKGLRAALEAQARKSVVPVDVDAIDPARYPQEIEAAVYFSCLEALQNVAKYAEASRATLCVARSNGELTFEVADDGNGFDPAATRYGTGLQGIADRLGALDGTLSVVSAPGSGTHLVGRIPVAVPHAERGVDG